MKKLSLLVLIAGLCCLTVSQSMAMSHGHGKSKSKGKAVGKSAGRRSHASGGRSGHAKGGRSSSRTDRPSHSRYSAPKAGGGETAFNSTMSSTAAKYGLTPEKLARGIEIAKQRHMSPSQAQEAFKEYRSKKAASEKKGERKGEGKKGGEAAK